MRIGISTWFHYENYGTILQAVALQQYLRDLGHEVFLLNYIPTPVSRENINLKRKIKIKKKISNKIGIQLLNVSKVKWKHGFNKKSLGFKKMIQEYCVLTSEIHNREEAKKICKHFDVLICGSDQIWNPNWLDGFYFLQFAEESTKKIAYAPSFGVSQVKLSSREIIRKYLLSFDCITVREKQAAKIVHQLIGKVPEVVVDPTLLLGKERWESFIGTELESKEKYALCYFLGEKKSQWIAMYKSVKKKGLKIKIIPQTGYSYFKKGEVLKEVSPVDFISLIHNAEEVYTDSFHATVFSIIFKRDFYIFERFDNADPGSQNSRIYNLIDRLSLHERLLDYNCNCISEAPRINYKHVENIMNTDIKLSKELLMNCMEE